MPNLEFTHPRRSVHLPANRTRQALAVLLVAAAGYATLMITHAATNTGTAEAENGTLSGGASIIAAAGTSNGKVVQFHAASSGGSGGSSGGSGGSGGGSGSGSGSGSSGGSGSGTTATCSTGGSKLATLTDSFPGNSLNSNNWYLEPIGNSNTPSGSAKVSGGVLTLSQNTGYTSVNSQKSYDVTGSCGFMKLIPDPNSSADQADDGWGIWNSTPVNGIPSFSNGYEIGVQGTKLYVEKVIGDNEAPFSFSANYNPSTMAYARIRESGGKLYFGYSADGKNWTEPSGWSMAWSSSVLDIKNASVQIYAGNLGNKDGGSAGFADFNVAK